MTMGDVPPDKPEYWGFGRVHIDDWLLSEAWRFPGQWPRFLAAARAQFLLRRLVNDYWEKREHCEEVLADLTSLDGNKKYRAELLLKDKKGAEKKFSDFLAEHEKRGWFTHLKASFEKLNAIDQDFFEDCFIPLMREPDGIEEGWAGVTIGDFRDYLDDKKSDIHAGKKLVEKIAVEVAEEKQREAKVVLGVAREKFKAKKKPTRLLARNSRVFERKVRRRFKTKDNRLRRVTAFLKQYQKTQGPYFLIRLHKALWNWRCKEPITYARYGTFGAMLYNEIMQEAEATGNKEILSTRFPDRAQFKPRYKLAVPFETNFKPDRGDVVYGLSRPRGRYAEKMPDDGYKGEFWTIDQYNNLAFVTNWVNPRGREKHQKKLDLEKAMAMAMARKGTEEQVTKTRAYRTSILKSRYNPSQVRHIGKLNLQQMEGFVPTDPKDQKQVEEKDANNSCYKAIRRGCKFGIGLVATHPAFVSAGAKVHFILDDLDMEETVQKKKGPGHSGRVSVKITVSEIRYIYRNWPWLTHAVIFYLDGKTVEPPWRKDYDVTLPKYIKKGVGSKRVAVRTGDYQWVSKKSWWAKYGSDLAKKTQTGKRRAKPVV